MAAVLRASIAASLSRGGEMVMLWCRDDMDGRQDMAPEIDVLDLSVHIVFISIYPCSQTPLSSEL